MSTILSSRQLDHDTSAAKKAASKGPVIITDRGKPAFVLLSYAAYQQLRGPIQSIATLLAMPDGSNLDIEIPKASYVARDVDLT